MYGSSPHSGGPLARSLVLGAQVLVVGSLPSGALDELDPPDGAEVIELGADAVAVRLAAIADALERPDAAT